MVLMILTIISFVGGFIAILYAILALFSMLKYSRAQKSRPEKFVPAKGIPETIGPPIAEAYCQRARILLKNERFDAALADCKRAIDINPKHAEANNLWKYALDREIPPEITEPAAEPAPVPAEEKIVKKKVKKVVKKVLRRKKVVARPAPEPKPEEKPSEEPSIVLEMEEPEIEVEVKEKPPKITPTPPEPVPEEKAEAPPAPEPVPEEPAEVEVQPEPEPEVEIEPVAEPEIIAEIPAEVEVTPEPTPEEEAAVEEAEAVAETIPEEGIAGEEEITVELEAEPEEPSLEVEAEVEAEPSVEPEISAETEEPAARQPLPGEEEGPLIPEDQLVAQEKKGESLLEEFDHEKLREFEEGEAEAGDTEWTRYADKKGPELPASKIQMHELPAGATGLKEKLTDLRQAETYNLQGEAHVTKNLFNNAIKDFSRALEINPNYVDALINRGSAYAQLGRFNDALMDFNHALKFEKKDAELYNKRGEVYLQNNMYDQAIKDFTAAVVLNPLFSDAYLNRGRAYSEKGMPEEAMNDFNQAIKADSDHSFGFVDRAAPSLQVDDDDSASREEATKFNQEGLASLKGGKYKEATESFTQAINLLSSDAEGYINRGRAYIKLEQIDEAMADFNQAVLFDPLNPILYYWRAQAWKAKNDNFNMAEDLKLSCEMGHEPACLEYRKIKPPKQ